MAENGKSESKVQRKCLSYLHSNHRVIRISNPARAGDSDAVACIYGLYVEIEFKKSTGGKQSPLQKVAQRKVESAGGIYLLISSFEEMKKKLKKLK